MSNESDWITTYLYGVRVRATRPMSAEEYFNKITHNNQGNVKK